MVHYVCERCGYETKRKSNFKNHLNRKKICPPLIDDIDIEMIRYKYNFCEKAVDNKSKIHNKIHNIHNLCSLEKEHKKNIFKQKTVTKKNTKRTFLSKIKQKKNSESDDELEISDISESDGKFFCDFCDREFGSKSSKYRHQKYYCKMKKNEKEILLESEIEKLKNEIKKMKRESGNTIQNGKTIQNIDTFNNIKNQQNNIIINNYNDENIDYITHKVLEKLITGSPYTSIPRLMECIHFNSKHPENHNLAITNMRSKFARVRKNNIWQVKFLNDLLEELINTKFNIIDEFYEVSGIKDKIGWKAKNYEKYRKLLFKDERIRDRIKKSLFESIINFTKELELKCT